MSQTTSEAPREPTRALTRALRDCRTISEAIQTKEFADRVGMAVPSQVKANTLLRSFIQATSRTPDLLKVDMRQGIGGFLTLAELGLPLTPTLGMAYMIPFKGRKKVGSQWIDIMTMNIVIGYQGLLELASRSGMVGGVHAEVVLPGDEFEYRFGTEQFLHHRPMGKEPPGAAPQYAWAIAHLRGDVKPPFEVMPWRKILATRDRSQGYLRALQARDDAMNKSYPVPKTYTEAPWIAHVVPMAEKTVFRQLSKWLPKSVELQGALAIDEPERGYVDFGPVIDGAVAAEGLPIEDDAVDPGTAHGTRRQEPEPAPAAAPPPPPAEEASPRRGRPPKPPAPAQAPAPPPPAPEPEPPADEGPIGDELPPYEQDQGPAAAPPLAARASPADTGWEAYLFDEVGEVITDAITDQMAFARQYVELLTNSPVEGRPMIQENNRDYIATLAPIPTDIIDRAERRLAQDQANQGIPPAPPPPKAEPIVAMQAAVGRDGKLDWPGYARAMKDFLPAVGVTVPAAQWVEAQMPNLRLCAAAQRIGLVKAISERFQTLGLPAPPDLAGLLRMAPAAGNGAAAETQQDKDRRYVEDRRADIMACTSKVQMQGIINQAHVTARLAEIIERGGGDLVSAFKVFAKTRYDSLP